MVMFLPVNIELARRVIKRGGKADESE
uniref:Uncharacterized protein n=1 Tax=Tetranychus urticae TaxID=32264 RepID=T1KUZ5_TETUR